jgi:aminoglycoside phosphotransferase (APT) family kinase protein
MMMVRKLIIGNTMVKSKFILEQNSRQADSLPIEKLAAYLNEKLPDFMLASRLSISQFSAGSSNLTYCLSNGEQALILRRPPNGTKAKSAHDMCREYNVLNKVSEYYSLSPKPILLCEDETVIGDKFFIMEQISGLSIGKNLPIEMNLAQQKSLCENFITGMVDLHNIDIEHTNLASLGKPDGYVERQLKGWQERYLKAKTDDVADSETLYLWLKNHLPYDSKLSSLIHNDYKFDNLILDRKQPDKIIGVLDWEMTTLGDPLMDLGCSLAYWVEKDDPKPLQQIRMMPTHLGGMMSRQQIFDRYCKQRELSGISLTPYYVFGLFRLAVIAQQIYYRFYHGQTDNPKFEHFGQLVNILINTAEFHIKGKKT